MTLHRALRITTITALFVATGLLLGIALLQAAGGGSEPETILACVKGNGQITLLSPVPEGGADPMEGCAPGQILIEWNVVGPQGLQGIPGTPGAAGPQGPEGAPGTSGDVGPEGPAGPHGLDGATGSPGSVGQEGPEGPAGPQGLDGDTGTPGTIGPQGPQGLDGATGTPGTIGPQGPQGLDGATGTPGTIGQQGPAGPQGLDGATGTPGAIGQQGPAGPQGLDGATGTPGTIGPQGAEGPPGPTASVDELDARLSALEAEIFPDRYAKVLRILGSQSVIFPIGDFDNDAFDETFTTRGDRQFTFDWSRPLANFDIPPGSLGGGVGVPVVTFNGTTEVATSPDDAYWSRGDGTSDRPFSIGVWVNVDTGSWRTILSRWESTGRQFEWSFHINGSEGLGTTLRDASQGAHVERITVAPIPLNQWVFLVATYDGASGPNAADTITLYVNGVVEASTATINPKYVAMEDLPNNIDFAQSDGSAFRFKGDMAGGPFGLFFSPRELTPAQILELFTLGETEMGL